MLSVCWFLVFRAWWLNSDGSTYLGTGRSVLDGLGFRLPDGGSSLVEPPRLSSPRRPASRLGGGIEASVWMSRVPLILAAPIIAAGTRRSVDPFLPRLSPVSSRSRSRGRCWPAAPTWCPTA